MTHSSSWFIIFLRDDPHPHISYEDSHEDFGEDLSDENLSSDDVLRFLHKPRRSHEERSPPPKDKVGGARTQTKKSPKRCLRPFSLLFHSLSGSQYVISSKTRPVIMQHDSC